MERIKFMQDVCQRLVAFSLFVLCKQTQKNLLLLKRMLSSSNGGSPWCAQSTSDSTGEVVPFESANGCTFKNEK